MPPQPPRRPANLRLLFAALFVLHALLLCFDYGRLPPAPVLGDEVIINDPSVTLALGHGFRAESLPGSRFLLDKYYAQFPPVYLLAEAAAIRIFGLSVYSLRSVTLLADLASLAVFLAGLLALVRWRLAEPPLTLAIAIFAAVNPAAIVMSRTARPDSTVYFFATLGFLLLISGLYRDESESARLPTLLLGAFAIGLALATHLEAIPIVVTAGIVILAAASATWLQKFIALAVIPLTFLAVCAATFGSKLMLAYRQWQAIVHLDDKIQPGILNQLRIVRENPRSGGLIFLVVAEAVLLLAAIPLLALWQRRNAEAARTPRHRLTLAFAVSSVLCLLLMQFVIPGSGHRYVILLPGLLFALAAALPQSTSSRLPTAASIAFAAVSLAVLALYFRTDRHHDDPAFSPHRYDALVDNIMATTPAGGRIATTPGLWLAFRQRNIPITLIYDPGFDATTPYHNQGPGSLDVFSTIILSEDDKNYADNAPRLQNLRGTLDTTQVGKETFAIFHRTP